MDMKVMVLAKVEVHLFYELLTRLGPFLVGASRDNVITHELEHSSAFLSCWEVWHPLGHCIEDA